MTKVVGLYIYLPPANEVWGKVICLQVCVCPWGGVPGPGVVPGPGGCLLQGGAWSRGVSGPGGAACSGGCLVLGGGVPAPMGVPGGAPPDGYCCGRYASYRNVFLFCM